MHFGVQPSIGLRTEGSRAAHVRLDKPQNDQQREEKLRPEPSNDNRSVQADWYGGMSPEVPRRQWLTPNQASSESKVKHI